MTLQTSGSPATEKLEPSHLGCSLPAHLLPPWWALPTGMRESSVEEQGRRGLGSEQNCSPTLCSHLSPEARTMGKAFGDQTVLMPFPARWHKQLPWSVPNDHPGAPSLCTSPEDNIDPWLTSQGFLDEDSSCIDCWGLFFKECWTSQLEDYSDTLRFQF